MGAEFNFNAWALRTAAACLRSDLDSGLVCADDTPDRELAEIAMRGLIDCLNRDADRIDPEGI